MVRNTVKKRRIILILAAFAIAVIAAAYYALPKGAESFMLLDADGIAIAGELSVYVGTETKTGYEIGPEAFSKRAVSYEVADDGVISVDENGVIHAKSVGETLLTAQAAGLKQNVNVTVKAAVKDITGLEEEVTLTEGEDTTLEPEIEMAAKGLDEPDITFSSEDENIATVDKEGVITAVDPGTTTITVKAASVSKKVKVTVNERVVVSTPTYTPQARSSGGGGSNRSNSGGSSNSGSDNGGWEE